MTALTTLVEPLKRELAVPGLFAATFPSTTDAALADTLADAFAEAQLSGFFSTLSLGPAPTYDTSEPLSLAGGYLVVLFAGQRVLRAWLRSLNTTERYKAGTTEFETGRGVNLLRDELALMRSKLDRLLADAERQRRGVLVYVSDNYAARMATPQLGAGYHQYELWR